MEFERNKTMNSALSDSNGALSVIGMFELVEEATTSLMHELGVDNFVLRDKYNCMWVFVRSRVRKFKSLPWSDGDFTVRSFVSSVSRATINIDTEILNGNNELCAYARVESCVLDKTTGRIRRLDTVGISSAETDTVKPPVELAFASFDDRPLEAVDSVRVRYTNIDMSHHTNNKEYVRFILNTYTVEQMETRPIREIEMRYVSQSFENNVLNIEKSRDGNRDIFAVTCDGNTVAKCEVVF